MGIFEIIAPIIAFIVFVGFFIFGLNYEKKNRIKVAATYQKIAATFQLELIPGVGSFWNYTYPKVVGNIDGVDILLYSFHTKGKNKTTFTNLSLVSSKTWPTLKIVKTGFLQKIEKVFGAQDLLIGDAILDEAYVFQCEDETLFYKAIDPEIQQLLLFLKDKLRAGLVIDKSNTFTYEFVGHLDDDAKREDLEKVLLLMLKIEKNLR